MTNVPITAVLQDRNLTVARNDVASTSVALAMTAYWVDNGANQMVTDTGDNLIFNFSTTAYPIELTAVLKDRDLTAERL